MPFAGGAPPAPAAVVPAGPAAAILLLLVLLLLSCMMLIETCKMRRFGRRIVRVGEKRGSQKGWLEWWELYHRWITQFKWGLVQGEDGLEIRRESSLFFLRCADAASVMRCTNSGEGFGAGSAKRPTEISCLYLVSSLSFAICCRRYTSLMELGWCTTGSWCRCDGCRSVSINRGGKAAKKGVNRRSVLIHFICNDNVRNAQTLIFLGGLVWIWMGCDDNPHSVNVHHVGI